MEFAESPTPYFETLSRERMSGEARTAIAALHRIMAQQGRLLEEANDRAFTDSLTGLSNRRAFDHDLEMLAHDLASMNRQGQADSNERFRRMLILGDIDYFKLVNDILGYSLGDITLVAVAKLLRKSMRYNDKLYRLGGDEFAAIIIVKRGMESNTFRAVSEKFHRYLDDSRFSEEMSPELEALQAIGMSFAHGIFTDTPSSVDDLTCTVDETMQRVKDIKEVKKSDLRYFA